jgi:aspartyl-tRNA(Asn)/glutamyl-tRNA(Gln) amidotransferase subunit A
VRAAIASLEAAGALVKEIDFPEVDAYFRAANAVLLVEAAAYHAETLAARPADYGAQVAALLRVGAGIRSVAYANGLRLMHQVRRGEADELLAGFDVLAMPATPFPAPTIEASRAEDPSAALAHNTVITDFTGQPAISVPCGRTQAGLPVGVMFTGRRWDEASVLWAGRAYEQVRGPFPAPPVA